MPLDGIAINCLKIDLKDLEGAKVNKISQPKKKDLVFNLYKGKGKNFKLYMTANSSNPRIHISNDEFTNPLTPPDFCMVLRKHLQGSSLVSVDQYKLDRVLKLTFKAYDEMNYGINKFLIIEIMGRHSNIILTDSDYKIIDSISRVNHSMSRVRQVLPGLVYETLEDEKLNLIEDDKLPSELIDRESNSQVYKSFYKLYTGLSPLIAKEICYLSNIDPEEKISNLNTTDLQKIDEAFISIRTTIRDKNYKPCIFEDSKDLKPIDFYAFKLKNMGLEAQYEDSMSAVLDKFYKSIKKSDRVNEKKNNLEAILKDKISFTTSRINDMKRQIQEAKDREKFKIYADLISANFHKLKGGEDSIEVLNFYDPDQKMIEIPLDIKKSAPQNAQALYKKYSKLKNRDHLFSKELPGIEEELTYLIQVRTSLNHVDSIEDLAEIEEELINEGYIKTKAKKKHKRDKEKASQPLRFTSTTGDIIYVGKNNKQNDYLTLKLAGKEDYFFHVQMSPGSHVIVKINNLDLGDKTILEAAYLAAYYSSLSNEDLVTVDYTQRKNVYKAKGAKPGMVYYNDFKSVTIDMRNEEITKVLQRKKEED